MYSPVVQQKIGNFGLTCSAQLQDQGQAVDDKSFLAFHGQQLCPQELHDQAIQGTEDAKLRGVAPLTTKSEKREPKYEERT